VVSFTSLPLYPRERAPGTHFIGGWVDPRAGLAISYITLQYFGNSSLACVVEMRLLCYVYFFYSCDTIFLNVDDPAERWMDDMKDSFYNELEHVFDKFPKYHIIKILLGDFNA
jgi:hypothetical protein